MGQITNPTVRPFRIPNLTASQKIVHRVSYNYLKYVADGLKAKSYFYDLSDERNRYVVGMEPTSPGWLTMKMQGYIIEEPEEMGVDYIQFLVESSFRIRVDSIDGKVKETITLLNSSSPRSFVFTLHGPDTMVVSLQADGSILISDAGQPSILLPAPTAEDSGSNPVPYHYVVGSEMAVGDRRYKTVELVPDDPSFSGVTFPVAIDPTIQITSPASGFHKSPRLNGTMDKIYYISSHDFINTRSSGTVTTATSGTSLLNDGSGTFVTDSVTAGDQIEFSGDTALYYVNSVTDENNLNIQGTFSATYDGQTYTIRKPTTSVRRVDSDGSNDTLLFDTGLEEGVDTHEYAIRYCFWIAVSPDENYLWLSYDDGSSAGAEYLGRRKWGLINISSLPGIEVASDTTTQTIDAWGCATGCFNSNSAYVFFPDKASTGTYFRVARMSTTSPYTVSYSTVIAMGGPTKVVGGFSITPDGSRLYVQSGSSGVAMRAQCYSGLTEISAFDNPSSTFTGVSTWSFRTNRDWSTGGWLLPHGIPCDDNYVWSIQQQADVGNGNAGANIIRADKAGYSSGNVSVLRVESDTSLLSGSLSHTLRALQAPGYGSLSRSTFNPYFFEKHPAGNTMLCAGQYAYTSTVGNFIINFIPMSSADSLDRIVIWATGGPVTLEDASGNAGKYDGLVNLFEHEDARYSMLINDLAIATSFYFTGGANGTAQNQAYLNFNNDFFQDTLDVGLDTTSPGVSGVVELAAGAVYTNQLNIPLSVSGIEDDVSYVKVYGDITDARYKTVVSDPRMPEDFSVAPTDEVTAAGTCNITDNTGALISTAGGGGTNLSQYLLPLTGAPYTGKYVKVRFYLDGVTPINLLDNFVIGLFSSAGSPNGCIRYQEASTTSRFYAFDSSGGSTFTGVVGPPSAGDILEFIVDPYSDKVYHNRYDSAGTLKYSYSISGSAYSDAQQVNYVGVFLQDNTSTTYGISLIEASVKDDSSVITLGRARSLSRVSGVPVDGEFRYNIDGTLDFGKASIDNSVTLDSGDGSKTVNVVIGDDVFNESTINDTVTLDQSPPLVSSITILDPADDPYFPMALISGGSFYGDSGLSAGISQYATTVYVSDSVSGASLMAAGDLLDFLRIADGSSGTGNNASGDQPIYRISSVTHLPASNAYQIDLIAPVELSEAIGVVADVVKEQDFMVVGAGPNDLAILVSNRDASGTSPVDEMQIWGDLKNPLVTGLPLDQSGTTTGDKANAPGGGNTITLGSSPTADFRYLVPGDVIHMDPSGSDEQHTVSSVAADYLSLTVSTGPVSSFTDAAWEVDGGVWGSDAAAGPVTLANARFQKWYGLFGTAVPTFHDVRLTDGDGTKTVNIKTRDAAGNADPAFDSDSIEVDTTPPLVSILQVISEAGAYAYTPIPGASASGTGNLVASNEFNDTTNGQFSTWDVRKGDQLVIDPSGSPTYYTVDYLDAVTPETKLYVVETVTPASGVDWKIRRSVARCGKESVSDEITVVWQSSDVGEFAVERDPSSNNFSFGGGGSGRIVARGSVLTPNVPLSLTMSTGDQTVSISPTTAAALHNIQGEDFGEERISSDAHSGTTNNGEGADGLYTGTLQRGSIDFTSAGVTSGDLIQISSTLWGLMFEVDSVTDATHLEYKSVKRVEGTGDGSVVDSGGGDLVFNATGIDFNDYGIEAGDRLVIHVSTGPDVYEKYDILAVNSATQLDVQDGGGTHSNKDWWIVRPGWISNNDYFTIIDPVNRVLDGARSFGIFVRDGAGNVNTL